jgi:muramoyltetrapeptide carboxypeptidase
VAARGGAGVIQLLERLDVERLVAHPKVFLGYSDLTFLHTLLNERGLVTFHGPMVARELAESGYHRDSLMAGVTGQGAPYASEADELLPIAPGNAEGRLVGGCLSILAAASGTPWALRGRAGEPRILLLEDVDEPPYKIDRMLRQLRAAGLFEGVRGLLLGDFPRCSPALDASYTLEDVILEALAGLELPIALGLSTGHTPHPNVTLPLGVRARLECGGERAEFRILEAAVA